MGKVFLVELEGWVFRCKLCYSPLALTDDVLSRSFNCRQGRAYLFRNVVNITRGNQEERLMLSGLHTVEDIFCAWLEICKLFCLSSLIFCRSKEAKLFHAEIG